MTEKPPTGTPSEVAFMKPGITVAGQHQTVDDLDSSGVQNDLNPNQLKAETLNSGLVSPSKEKSTAIEKVQDQQRLLDESIERKKFIRRKALKREIVPSKEDSSYSYETKSYKEKHKSGDQEKMTTLTKYRNSSYSQGVSKDKSSEQSRKSVATLAKTNSEEATATKNISGDSRLKSPDKNQTKNNTKNSNLEKHKALGKQKKSKSKALKSWPLPKPPPGNTFEEMVEIWKIAGMDENTDNEKEFKSNESIKHDKRTSPKRVALKSDSHNFAELDNSINRISSRGIRNGISKLKDIRQKKSMYPSNTLSSQKSTLDVFVPDAQNQSKSNLKKNEVLKTDIDLRDFSQNLEPVTSVQDEKSVASQETQDSLLHQKTNKDPSEHQQNTNFQSDTSILDQKENNCAENKDITDENSDSHELTESESAVGEDESDSDWRDIFGDDDSSNVSKEEDAFGNDGSSRVVRQGSNKLSKQSRSEQPSLPRDISRLDLRVGLIRQVVEHVLSRKYWIPYVKIGNGMERAAITYLRPYYERRALKGKRVLVVCNIREIVKGLDGDCLILFAKSGNSHELLEAAEDCVEGDRISVEGFPFTPDPKHRFIHPKSEGLRVVRDVMQDLRVDGQGRAQYRGVLMKTDKGGFLTAKTLRDCTVFM